MEAYDCGWELIRDFGVDEDGNDNVTVKLTSKTDSQVSFSKTMFLVNGAPAIGGAADRFALLNELVTYRDDDIVLATFPKCGTTWTEQVTLLLLNGGNAELLDPSTKNSYRVGKVGKLWPEASLEQKPGVAEAKGGEFVTLSKQEFDAAPSPRLIKTHAHVRNLLGTGGRGLESAPRGLKVVVVARNPLDACVSGYYHAWNPFRSGWPFDAWAAFWLSGYSEQGSWFDFHKTWMAEGKKHPGRVHWIQYEDMQRDAAGEVRRLAEFLGINASEELIQTVVEQSSFDVMKAQAKEKAVNEKGVHHMRKGKSGDWRNHFSAGLAETFKQAFLAECSGAGMSFEIGDGEVLQSPP